MVEQFSAYLKDKNYFKLGQKILLAVSGGVDSMVLLHCMEQFAKRENVSIGVAHINHKIRAESDTESDYIRGYCQQRGIPFFSRDWFAENKEKNTEARAREFRYNFFAEIMAKETYTTLLTAHHIDDQAETVLMKLTRGSSFANLVGIREKQPFKSGELIRPFLGFSKEELESYATKKGVVFFEDVTNQTNDYQRNRIRHQVIPVLKKENAQFLQHVEQFSEQVKLADDFISFFIKPKYEQWVQVQKNGWMLALEELKKEPDSVQFFFMHLFLQQTLIKKGIEIKQIQVQQLLKVINQATPQLKVELESDWVFKKEYNTGHLMRTSDLNSLKKIELNLLQGVFLSETEWLGLESSVEFLEIPQGVSEWLGISLEIKSEIPLPLVVRHRENGDKIPLKFGLTKKLNRLFIDKKIPNTLRNESWVILSARQEIIWVPKFGNSYLSIPAETDKIHYRLLYRSKE